MQGIMQTASASTSSVRKLLVGNLPDSTRISEVKDIFTPVGKVLSVSMLGHGFAFVEMTAADADRALTQLSGCQIGGRSMMLDEAHPRTPSRY
jgi:RNA recognition motif-containing protein